MSQNLVIQRHLIPNLFHRPANKLHRSEALAEDSIYRVGMTVDEMSPDFGLSTVEGMNRCKASAASGLNPA